MNTAQQKIFREALCFVQHHHRGQFRAGRSPVWQHLARVSQLLEVALDDAKEGSVNERFTIVLAALGHDLLEDTHAKEKETRKVFGKRGYELIEGMTNRWGDKNVKPYVRQVCLAEEAVRLIKLSDLYDNMTSVVYLLPLLGKKWATSYFLPIVDPMHKAVSKTRFLHYRKTALLLTIMVNTAYAILRREIYWSSDKRR